MSERKWEDLEPDCLLNVFKKVGMESLLLEVPFVCKSWHKASLDPSCWEKLAFPQGDSFDRFKARFVDVYELESLPEAAFMKLVIDRSCKSATGLSLPYGSTEDVLKYAADECPVLKHLALPSDVIYEQSETIMKLIGKWKSLEGLVLGSSCNLTKILPEIRLNCKNFDSLYVAGASFGEEEAVSIVANFPKIRELILKGAIIRRDSLVKILKGCKDLVLLDVRDCIGYEADDKIMELASHVKKFKHEGSKTELWGYVDDHLMFKYTVGNGLSVYFSDGIGY